jgi:hypothetical protein
MVNRLFNHFAPVFWPRASTKPTSSDPAPINPSSTSPILPLLSTFVRPAASFPIGSWLIFRSAACTIGVIQPQLPAICLFRLEQLHRIHSALNINEVSVGETSGLAGTSVNGNAHINNVLDASEKSVQIAISHFEGHVTNEEGFGGRIERL